MSLRLRPALLVFAAFVALTQTGCRGRLGAACRCAADCRDGLACAAEGEKALVGELCYDPGIVGECIEVLEADTDNGSGSDPTERPIFMDMSSKRDFLPGESVSDSMTGYATDTDATGTGGTSGTSTGGTSTGGTSTGPDTSTSSTSGSTGESTSTGGTTTTGTTGGTTSGTTGGTTSGTTEGSTGSTG